MVKNGTGKPKSKYGKNQLPREPITIKNNYKRNNYNTMNNAE